MQTLSNVKVEFPPLNFERYGHSQAPNSVITVGALQSDLQMYSTYIMPSQEEKKKQTKSQGKIQALTVG